MFGSQVLLVVEPGSQHLLRVGDDVGPALQVEMLMAPHFPRGPPASLDLINDQLNVVLAADVLQSSKPVAGAVMVTALGLDRLRNDPGGGTAG